MKVGTRLIDPTKTRTRIERNERTVVKHRDHHDGHVDGKVYLQTIRVKLTAAEGAPLNIEQVKAIGAYEEATQAWRIAKHSGIETWRADAAARLDQARRRLEDNQ